VVFCHLFLPSTGSNFTKQSGPGGSRPNLSNTPTATQYQSQGGDATSLMQAKKEQLVEYAAGGVVFVWICVFLFCMICCGCFDWLKSNA
jgi:hypothetical protein